MTVHPIRPGTVLRPAGAPNCVADTSGRVAAEVAPGDVVRAGAARWTVARVTRFHDVRQGQMVSAIGRNAAGERFAFCKKATARVQVVEP